MTTEQQLIKRSDLLNRRAIDRKTVKELGKVDQLWVDPQSHQVIGFTCKSGFLGKNKQWFAWSQVETLGENILLNINSEVSATQQPEHSVAMIGSEILNDEGNPIGSLVDYFLDGKTGSVVNYLFNKSSGWRGVLDGIYLLSPTAISSVGSKGLIVSSEAIAQPQQYAEGLNQKAQAVKEAAQDQAQAVMEKAQAVKEAAQDQAQAVMEKAQSVKEAAQDQAQAVMEKAQAVKEAAQDQAQAVKEAAQDQAQAVMEKAQAVKESAQDQAQAVMEKAQSVKESAQEQAQAVKEMASEKTQIVMEKAQAVKEAAQDQAQAVKEAAQEHTQAVMEKAQSVKVAAQEKIDEVRSRREDTSEPAATEAIKEGIEEAIPSAGFAYATQPPKDPE